MLVMLVPTMIWVRLRAPWAEGLVEFLCLLPLTIPALVIVVGLRNVYPWVTYFLGESALTLTFVYVVLVLPFAYRAIDAALSAIDVKTLAEAARSLGAGWATAIVRVVVPNIWSGILSAAFISIAVVLGEYTIASLSRYETLQVQIVADRQEPTARRRWRRRWRRCCSASSCCSCCRCSTARRSTDPAKGPRHVRHRTHRSPT